MTDPFTGDPMTHHPGTELIAAYLSGTLPPRDQATFESHMARCRPCRQEVTSARRLIWSRPSRRRQLLLVPAAAAAVLTLVLLNRAPGPANEPVRGGDEAGIEARLTALAPADRDTVGGRGLAFIWASRPGRPLYRVTVTDESGQAVWLRDASDTVVVLPEEVVLDRGRTYFWYVDALDAQGTSLTTGTHRFTISP